MARDSKGKGRRVDEVVEEEEEDEVPSNTQNTAMEVDEEEDAEGGESSSANKGPGKGTYDPEQGEAASCRLQWKRRVY